MGPVNAGKVLMGGLLAGLIINVSSFIANAFVFADQFAEVIDRLGVAEPSGGMMVVYIIFGFVLGIAAVWIYAAIRPRFGPGPRTAVIAGLTMWFLARAWPITDIGMFLDMGSGLMIGGYLWTLVESVLATVAGAWLYREGDEATS